MIQNNKSLRSQLSDLLINSRKLFIALLVIRIYYYFFESKFSILLIHSFTMNFQIFDFPQISLIDQITLYNNQHLFEINFIQVLLEESLTTISKIFDKRSSKSSFNLKRNFVSY